MHIIFVLAVMCVYHTNAQDCVDGTTDIQILPACTLTGLLNSVDVCSAAWMEGYPYTTSATCRNNIDNTIMCMVSTARSCAVGSCDYVLNVIPEVGPLIPQLILNYTEGINSISSILDLVLPPNDPTGILIENLINEFACPTVRAVPASLTQLIDSNMINLTTIANPVCDTNDLQDVLNKALTYMNQFYTLTTSVQLCTAGNTFRTESLQVYDTRCDQTQLDELIAGLTALIPSEFQHLVPQIDVAVNIVENYIRTTQVLPGCGSGGIIVKSNWGIYLCIAFMFLSKSWF